MDAREYIREKARLCKTTGICRECVLNGICNTMEANVMTVIRVEQWSKENPIITNLMNFEEVFGESVLEEDRKKLLGWWWDQPYEGNNV